MGDERTWTVTSPHRGVDGPQWVKGSEEAEIGEVLVPLSRAEAAERENRRLREALKAARPWMDAYEDYMGSHDFRAREKAIERVEEAIADSSEGATREEQTG